MQSITGTWQLIHTECIGEDGQSLSPPYGGAVAMGLISLSADGRMISVLYEGGDKPQQGQPREYNSYCGSYQYDGKRLVTRVDACSAPSFFDTDQIRDVSFKDNGVMVLRPAEGTGPVSDGQRILHWVKLPAAELPA